jgi:mono/diheme cytochrome c family protein
MKLVLYCMLPIVLFTSISQAQDPASLTGNAERGKTLFIETFKCASCHGTTAVSGSPRLLPMRRTQGEFITFVQKPTLNAMPAYGDQSQQALADVYAYIKSLPVPSPPALQSNPILSDILKTVP